MEDLSSQLPGDPVSALVPTSQVAAGNKTGPGEPPMTAPGSPPAAAVADGMAPKVTPSEGPRIEPGHDGKAPPRSGHSLSAPAWKKTGSSSSTGG
jgi:hypothetical protein